MKTDGADLLSSLGLTQQQISERTDINIRYINHWTTGRAIPPPSIRVILHKEFGIPPIAWERTNGATGLDDPNVVRTTAYVKNGSPKLVAASSTEPIDLTVAVRMEAEHLIREVQTLRRKVGEDPDLDLAMQARILSQTANTLSLLGKLTGETQIIDERKILKLPEWRRILERVAFALKPWPEAMRAIGEEFNEDL